MGMGVPRAPDVSRAVCHENENKTAHEIDLCLHGDFGSADGRGKRWPDRGALLAQFGVPPGASSTVIRNP